MRRSESPWTSIRWTPRALSGSRGEARARRSIALAIALYAPLANADETARSVPTVTMDAESPEARARLTMRNDIVGENAAASRRWFWGFTGFFASAIAVEAVIYGTADDRGLRADAAVTIVKSTVAIVASLVTAPPTLFAKAIDLRVVNAATKETRAEMLADRERLIERAAASERLGHSALAHIGVLALNAAGLIYLLAAEDVPVRATLGFASGVAVGEFRIWTQPRSAMLTANGPTAGLVPTISRDSAGLRVVGRF
jgi:hypothetical protein